jgi:hypothetical protein
MKTSGYAISVGKPERKIQLERHRPRWENDNKMDLKEVGCEDAYRIHLAQGRAQWRTLLNTVINLRVL